MALLSLFLRHIDEEKVHMNTLAFQVIDESHSGQIDRDEMLLAFQDLSFSMPELEFTSQDVITVFEKLDLEKTELITYSQFMVATLDLDLLLDDQLI